MILSYTELKLEVQAARVLHPVEDVQINAASIDVRLGACILEECEPDDDEEGVVMLRERTALHFRPVILTRCGWPYLLKPGRFVLAQTIEEFNLPLTLSAEFRLKSSAARMGLGHALAVWADAGWHGSVLTLELQNLTQHHTLGLHYGDRIGQMIFHRHAAVPLERSYTTRGAYNNNLTTNPARPEK